MGLTGLEPVTLRLSSACSNQLSYRPGKLRGQFIVRSEIRNAISENWRQGDYAPASASDNVPFSLNVASTPFRLWRQGDSNPCLPACKAGALPTELCPHTKNCRMSIADLRFQAITDVLSNLCILTLFLRLPGFLIQRSGASRGEHHANDQSDHRPANIDHHVNRRCRPRGHKRLMEFVSHCKNRRSQPGEQKQDRHLCLQISTAAQRPPNNAAEIAYSVKCPSLRNAK